MAGGVSGHRPKKGQLSNLALGWSHVSSKTDLLVQGPMNQLLMGCGGESGLSRVRLAFFFSYEIFSVNYRELLSLTEL